jgi:ribosomal subunit interface protein
LQSLTKAAFGGLQPYTRNAIMRPAMPENDVPLRITLKDIDQTPALETKIREKAGKLGQFYDRIVDLHVTIESPERRHHKGKLYNVHVHLHVPGEELVVTREPSEDLYVALRDAFDAARRQLLDYVDRRRGR